MSKKHIVTYGYSKFAFDSVTAATQAVAFFSKLKPVKLYSVGKYESWHYRPKDDAEDKEVSLEINQKYQDPVAPKPAKALALPSPKRGTILCICEKSYVAPRETCPHCGRDFSESHNRTHQDKSTGPKLRLLP
jgi:hypothetical protein